MIYICIPARDEAATVGLLLWKIRKVFEEFPREYQLLVIDDGSSDETAAVLERYRNVLPLTASSHAAAKGYPGTVQELLELALERSDRPKRDCVILMPADFTADADQIPEFVKRLERGIDLVVGERDAQAAPGRGHRWARKLIPWLIRGRVKVDGLEDLTSGFLACRLISVRNALRRSGNRLMATEGWLANAELVGKLAAGSRRVEAVAVSERYELRQRPSRVNPWAELRRTLKDRKSVSMPAAEEQPAQDRPERRKRGRPPRKRKTSQTAAS